MTFEPLNDRFIRHLEHSLASPATPVPSASSPAPALTSTPAGLFLSDVPDQPLTWLWPGRIPCGHLTLLDAVPGCDPSLLALTLAACISSGKPLPGGTPTRPGNVILFAPYDSASATLKPRLQAAGGDPARVLLFHPPIENASRTTTGASSFMLPRDLEHLAHTIRCLDAPLVILDPASAIPGLLRCLPALSALAQQTNCAILLTRTLNQPPADPLRSSGPASPLHEAVCCRILLTIDPADERHHLLITTRHPHCTQPSILAYDLPFSDEGILAIRWLAERDHIQLARLSTAPLHSPHRQAILQFLHNSDSPRSIPDILAATCYDPEAGRKMLTRMKLAGELVSTARGLYTTSTHPSLAQLINDPLPVPNVQNAAALPSQGTGAGLPSLACPRPGLPLPTVADNPSQAGLPVLNVPIAPDNPSQGTGEGLSSLACPCPGSSLPPGSLVSTVQTPSNVPSSTVPGVQLPSDATGSTHLLQQPGN